MTVSYFVRYQGQPNDPKAFLDYYRRTHAGFMQAFPRVRSAILHHPIAWNDPVPVKPDARFMLAQVLFDAGDTATLRADVVVPPLGNDAALANAPQAGAGYFKVPRVIER